MSARFEGASPGGGFSTRDDTEMTPSDSERGSMIP